MKGEEIKAEDILNDDKMARIEQQKELEKIKHSLEILIRLPYSTINIIEDNRLSQRTVVFMEDLIKEISPLNNKLRDLHR